MAKQDPWRSLQQRANYYGLTARREDDSLFRRQKGNWLVVRDLSSSVVVAEAPLEDPSAIAILTECMNEHIASR